MYGPLCLGIFNHELQHAIIFYIMIDGPSKEEEILIAIGVFRSGRIKSLQSAEATFGVSRANIRRKMTWE